MKLSSKSPFTLIVAATLVACAMGFLAPLSGQEAKAKAKTKGRLPAYFAQVVDAKQREQIYSIQAKYKEQIEKLEAELKAANDKLKEEVEAVLSKEQKEKLDKLRAEAKPRGKAGKATPSKEEANDASKTQ
jgi:flagellar basal body-associated protein FliL